MVTPPLIPDGNYHIRTGNPSSSDYLVSRPDGSITLAVASSANNAPTWTISHLNDGTYNIVAYGGSADAPLSTEDANKLVCVPDGSRSAWTIEPKGNKYVIGNVEKTMAINFTQLRVLVFPRNNGPNQRWFLERVGADGSVEESARTSTVTMAPPSVAVTSSVRASSGSDNTVKTFYFGTRPLNADDLKNCVSVRLETDAHNPEGGNPSEGMHSWFEIAILRSAPSTGESAIEHIKTHKNVQLTWRSHVLPLRADYVKQAGLVFDRTHPLWANLEAGDVIGVLACARYYSWSCHARSGELRFERNAV